LCYILVGYVAVDVSVSQVYAVHAVRANEITAILLICQRQVDAERQAKIVSGDPGVLAGAVTEYVLDTPGRRTPVALYVRGQKQAVPYISDNRQVYANGRGGAHHG
jgi:hypothetical protein